MDLINCLLLLDANLSEDRPVKCRAILDLFVLQAFEVIDTPKRDWEGIELLVIWDLPRVLDQELEPDVVTIICENVPFESDSGLNLRIIRSYAKLQSVNQLHSFISQVCVVSEVDERRIFVSQG